MKPLTEEALDEFFLKDKMDREIELRFVELGRDTISGGVPIKRKPEVWRIAGFNRRGPRCLMNLDSFLRECETRLFLIPSALVPFLELRRVYALRQKQIDSELRDLRRKVNRVRRGASDIVLRELEAQMYDDF